MEFQLKSFSLREFENNPLENRFFSVDPERRNPNSEDRLTKIATRQFFMSLALTEKDDLISISFTKKNPGSVTGRLTFTSDDEEYCKNFVNFNVFPFYYEHKIKKKCFRKVSCYFANTTWINFNEIENFVAFTDHAENQENLQFLKCAHKHPKKLIYVEKP